MKAVFLLSGLLFLTLAVTTVSRSDEARASVYIVDHSPEFTDTGGACFTSSPVERSAKERQMLGIAKGPPGSTLLMMAFDRDALHLNLAPVLAPQTEDSKAVRFPAEGAVWPFDKASASVDLYIAVFLNDDPNLPRFAEYVGWLREALTAGDKDTAMLHTLAIKNRLSTLLRQKSVDSYRVNFGDMLTDGSRLPPSSKAAVTRSAIPPGVTKPEQKNPIAAAQRGLKTLENEWSQDSRAIPFGLASPGVLVFPISAPAAP